MKVMNRVLRHIRRAALLHARDAPTDAELLESFLTQRDEAAFEALLYRHGAMVLGVCRRVLRHAQDAEDAFQATFLVLARKAGSLRSRELLGNWLYGVALRTAMKARAMNAKRRKHERRAGAVSRPEPPDDGPSEELLRELDAALSRLPEQYRVPIVLCELEGKRRKEVAGMLGLPEGTVASRVAYAKKLLAKRLARFGAGALGAVLSGDALSACVPHSLLKSTAKAALHLVAGQTLTAGMVSAQVVFLTEGVLKVMFLSKLKTVWVVVLALLVGAGAVGLTYRTAMAQSGKTTDASPVTRASADELEELRLEVAALRKGLEATRTRVKVLEGEVQTLKAGRSQSGGLYRAEEHMSPTKASEPGQYWTPTDTPNQALGHQPAATGTSPFQRNPDTSTGQQPQSLFSAPRERADGPLAEAEAALKKLRANPQDKEAADALDRALQRLKEREQKRSGSQDKSGPPADPGKR
jgi:RNA polymerase sigma factor (sigma-70 family)